MADEKDPEETSAALQESDYEIPGIPNDSPSVSSNASKTSRMSKIQSLISTILSNGSASASNTSQPKEEGPKDEPSIQKLQEEASIPDETSKSQEELKKSQEVSLNGKKTSLDRLSKDVSQGSQKSRTIRPHRQCQRRFREIIGKRELKNEELERQQGDLQQRLNILECSMPAVMVWNIWRMSQGTGVPSLKQVLEKQFQGPASGEVYCPSTPSRHFDCRVREVEAERKQAQKRADEARTLWTEKEIALEEKNQKLEEARRAQEQIKENIEKLKIEAQKLREAAVKVKDDGACESGECGVIECKKKWLEKVPSSASIKSTDIECLEKLQQLAEAELCMKKQIANLENREEAYMRTLQQADELWSQLQGDATSTLTTLQEQLDVKTTANQQMADRIVQLEDSLEKLRTRMAGCRNELEKFMSIERIEALIGRDDDFADVADQEIDAEVTQKHRMAGREDDVALVEEKGVLSKEEVSDKDTLVRPDVADLATAVYRENLIPVDDAQLGIKPEDFAYEAQRLEEAKEYLAAYGSLSELLADDDDDYVCSPDFSCNDQVFTETGLTEEELTALNEGRVTAEMLLKTSDQDKQPSSGVIPDAGRLPATTMKTVERTERSEETVKLPYEVKEEELVVTEEVIVESDMKVDDGHEEPGNVLKEKETDVAQEAFIEIPGSKDEIGEQMAIKSEEEGYTSPQDTNNILVPRDELVLWQDNVDTIRETIAKCPDCLPVKKDADELAKKMARHTGKEMKEVIDDLRQKEQEIKEERTVEQVSTTEIEVHPEEKEQVEPEVEKVAIIADLSPTQETLVVLEEVAAPTIEKEAKDVVEDPKIQEVEQKVAEEEAPRSEEHRLESPRASEVLETSKEPSEALAAKVTPSPVMEEKPSPDQTAALPPEKQAVPVAEEKGPEEGKKTPLEPVETQITPTADEEEMVAPVEEAKKAPTVEAEMTKVPAEQMKDPKPEVVKTEDKQPGKVEEVSPVVEEMTEVDRVTAPEEKKESEVVEEVTKEKKKEVPAEKKEETEPQMLPKKDEDMDTARKKEIDADVIPEKEELVPKEETIEVDMLPEKEETAVEIPPQEEEIVVEVLQELEEKVLPKEEETVVEVLLEEEEPPVIKEEKGAELLPEKKEEETVIKKKEEIVVEVLQELEEEEIPKEGETVVEVFLEEEEPPVIKEEEIAELLPEKKEEEIPKEEEEVPQVEDTDVEPLAEKEEETPKEEEEVIVELLAEEKEEEVPKEEEIEVEMLPEKEEAPEVEELPTDEAEEATVLTVDVLPEKEEVEIEVEVVPLLEEEVQEVPIEEIIESEKSVDEEEIEKEVEVSVELVPEEVEETEKEVPAEEKKEEEKEVIEVPVSDELEVPVQICTSEICREELCLGREPAAEKEEEEKEVIEVPVSDELEVPVQMCTSETCREELCLGREPAEEKEEEEEEVIEVPVSDELEVPVHICTSEICRRELCLGREPAPVVPIPEVPIPEEIVTYPCVCASISEELVSEEPKAPDLKVPHTLPCVCSFVSEAPEASVPEEMHNLPCVCSSIPETPEASVPEEMRKPPRAGPSIPEVPKAPVPKEMRKPPYIATPIPEAPGAPVPKEPVILPHVLSFAVAAGLQREPSTRIEITQTELTRTTEAMQVVTQTVSDMGTQTPLMSRLIRRPQRPQIITITRPVDPELKFLNQLTNRIKPITESSFAMSTDMSNQTEKSSILQVKATNTDIQTPSLRISEILQSLKAEVAHLKSDPEEELKSIHYGKKLEEPETGKCNCCLCGKDVSSSTLADPKTKRQSSTVFKLLPSSASTRKTPIPGVDQGMQHETVCPDCKIRKLQDTLRFQEIARQPQKQLKKPTCDKEVCVCPSIGPRCIPFQRLKKKIDQSCTARIPKAGFKTEKPLKRDKPDPEKEVHEIMPATKMGGKESSMHCVCNAEVDSEESEASNKVRCACGDPD